MSESVLDMHRLVQISTKKWLELHDELRRWLELHDELRRWQKWYIEVMEEAFPTGSCENWPTCQTLFSHVEAMEGYRAGKDGFLQNLGERGLSRSLVRMSNWTIRVGGEDGTKRRTKNEREN